MVRVSQPLSVAALALAIASPALAWWRVSCTAPIVQERVDPIVSPGISPSNHVHTVHGAKNFAPNSTFDTLRASSCTNCLVKNDLSNYWFPQLYFKNPKTGAFTSVPNGGLLIYYQLRGDQAVRYGGKGLTAFPKGFKMLTGSATARSMNAPLTDNSQWALAQRAAFYTCLRYTTSNTDYEGYGFPNTDCEAGLNHRLHFPACWTGKDVATKDNSHVAYLDRMDNGLCPSTHPIGLMKLFYEVTWDVHSFVTSGAWNPATTPWPFVLATGDPTGFSWHGDFQNGWDVATLQAAINTCDNQNDQTGQGITEACSLFQMQTADVATTCKVPTIVNEQVLGTLAKLPGCNPIQAGPQNATIYSDANCPK